jgi:dCMP deaminase
MAMAILVSTRSTCQRRQVGCVLVDKDNHVLATGYNGVPSGMVHCLDDPCPGALSESGKDLDQCYATHAEQNALLQCRDVKTISRCYSTTAPCVTCVKLLLNTTTMSVIFNESYAQSSISKKLWSRRTSSVWKCVTNHGLGEIRDVINRSHVSTRKQLDTSNIFSEADGC